MKTYFTSSYLCLLSFLLCCNTIGAYTPDTLRSIERNRCRSMLKTVAANQQASTEEELTVLACPEIQLPSETGPKCTFRYIDGDCSRQLNIVPAFGVTGGNITGYTVSRIPYAPPFGFTEGTPIFISEDDKWGDAITLPFPFCFYDGIYTKAVVGANGAVSFNTNLAGTTNVWNIQGTPNIPDPSYISKGLCNAIMGVFEDIDPNKINSVHSGGSIHYGILGTAPCRTLTVSWYQVPTYGSACASDPNYWETYQTVMYEGTNIIDVYVHNKSYCPSWNEGRAIIGLQNANGTQGIAPPGRNSNDQWTARDEAWRFVPSGTPDYTITYYEGFGVDGPVLGQGKNIVIDPQEVDSITVRLQFTACNGTVFDLRDSAVILHREGIKIERNALLWYGERYDDEYFHEDTPGTYHHTILGHDGCDSVNLTLNLRMRGLDERFDTICTGQTFEFYGDLLRSTGEYRHVIHLESGHDSTSLLHLAVFPKYHFREKVSLCQDEDFQWRGTTYNQTGTYYDSLFSIYGCDSIYELQLEVLPSYEQNSEVNICSNQAYIWRNRQLLNTGTYYDSLLTYRGCDSIYRIEFSNMPIYKTYTPVHICDGEYYEHNGHRWTTSGIHYDSLKTQQCHCDSISAIEVFVHKKQIYHEKAITTEGVPYTWHNKEYRYAGTYYDTLTSNWGCDSIFELKLQTCRPFEQSSSASICDYEHYSWRGNTYNQPGTYYDSLTSTLGCDSTYIFTLYVHPTQRFHTTDSICGTSYPWRGQQLTRTGFFVDTTYNPEQGLCEINSIYLTLKQKTYLTKAQVEDVCANDREFEIQYVYHGEAPTIYSVLFDPAAKAVGFRDIIQQPITGPIMAHIPQPTQEAYIHPDMYHGELIVDNSMCENEQNGQTFSFLVKYPSWIIQQNWSDVVALLNNQQNGGYFFSNYQWNINGKDINYGSHPNLYYPNLQIGDLVCLYLTREGENYAIPTCPITIEPFMADRPNAITYELKHHKMSIQSSENGEYQLYNMMGHLITSGFITNGITEIDLTSAPGCYMLHIKTDSEEYVKKIIIEYYQ